MTSFSDNPFSFGDDAAFIDSPVTMLKLGDEDGEGDKRNGKDKDQINVGRLVGFGIGLVDWLRCSVSRAITSPGIACSD